jgi:DNA-binding MarR family transcriptional regulator
MSRARVRVEHSRSAQAEPIEQGVAISRSTERLLREFKLEEVATHLIRRAHFFAEEMFAREFADESITPRQKAALVTIYQNAGLSQNALADRLFMDRNTVAEMVKRLADAGLVDRHAAIDDHRAYRLYLTPAGGALLDRVMPRDLLVEQRVLDKLPPEYRQLFIKCLRLMVEPGPDPGRAPPG